MKRMRNYGTEFFTGKQPIACANVVQPGLGVLPPCRELERVRNRSSWIARRVRPNGSSLYGLTGVFELLMSPITFPGKSCASTPARTPRPVQTPWHTKDAGVAVRP